MRRPGWCSGPSYDPVTVVTRVQIPPRALLRFHVHERRLRRREYDRNRKAATKEFEARSELNDVSETTEVQIPPQALSRYLSR